MRGYPSKVLKVEEKGKMIYCKKTRFQCSIIPMPRHSAMKCLIFMFCMGLWFFSGYSPVRGARVAGEEGVKSVTSVVRKNALRPNGSNSAVKSRPRRIPVKVRTNHFRNGNNGALRNNNNHNNNTSNKNSKHDPGYVAIEFDNVDILIFIKFISELTGKNFVVDKAVRGKVTIISPKKISVKEAYKVFESILEVHGFTTVPAGSIIKIVPAIQARTKDIETRLRKGAVGPEDKVVTQLIPLKYADPLEEAFCAPDFKKQRGCFIPPHGHVDCNGCPFQYQPPASHNRCN